MDLNKSGELVYNCIMPSLTLDFQLALFSSKFHLNTNLIFTDRDDTTIFIVEFFFFFLKNSSFFIISLQSMLNFDYTFNLILMCSSMK